MTSKQDLFVVPGMEIDLGLITGIKDENSQTENSEESAVILGPGLFEKNSKILSFAAGNIATNFKDTIWVNYNKKRYIPEVSESIIGTVVARTAEGYKVDIGSAQPANLNGLSFENATKRNRPNLSVGTIVYAKVVLSNKYIEPEIECFNRNTGKADGYGELEDGFVIKASLGYCFKLFKGTALILELLGNHIAYELAVGLNGFVWVKAGSPETTILVANAIKNAEHLSESDCALMVKQLVSFL
ncbi:hypothetical protein BB560_004364 [Smittium megazygosporum]|uniref:Ribosomal RNA-processing protein 40 n=1 Tax=Smittium megazygosporum TaxID=133381 RepID=A0A2T9Z9M3_9FUNG|nr:hypothetical protein BB560_004364 [Smittium megazygosporum]